MSRWSRRETGGAARGDLTGEGGSRYVVVTDLHLSFGAVFEIVFKVILSLALISLIVGLLYLAFIIVVSGALSKP